MAYLSRWTNAPMASQEFAEVMIGRVESFKRKTRFNGFVRGDTIAIGFQANDQLTTNESYLEEQFLADLDRVRTPLRKIADEAVAEHKAMKARIKAAKP